MTKLLHLSFLIFLLTIGVSCKKDDTTPNSVSNFETYFDLTPGRYIVYDVFEVFHDETALIKHDTSVYQLKTLVGDTIIDNQGRIARKYIRSKRNSSSESWVITDVWTTIIEGNRAELVEENERIIKMMFPISLSTKWNANVFNAGNSLDCFYSNIHKPMQLNGLQFDSTSTIDQENERNLIEYRRKYETYANHVGMVLKFYKDLKISNFDTLNIKSGHEYKYTCIDFGIE